MTGGIVDNPQRGPLLDLANAGLFGQGHPFEIYDQLRREQPVYRHPGDDFLAPFWILTRYADIQAVSLDNDNFSSRRGFNLPKRVHTQLDPSIRAALGQNILAQDPPDHSEFRRSLMPGFAPASIRALEVKIFAFVAELMDGLEGRTEVEFVAEVASKIPIRVMCALLGIPEEDESKIFDWTNRMVGSEDPEYAPDPKIAQDAFLEVFAYGKWLVDQRRMNPSDDLMSAVAHGQMGGRPLGAEACDGIAATLIAAGNETTRNALTGSVLLLSQNLDVRDQLSRDPELIPAAIDELLRRITPVIHMIRTAKQDVRIGDCTIAEGDMVAMVYGAANHDPAVFADPYRLDIGRENARRHLAFGTGAHVCLGARLAQIEMKILLKELLTRYPNIRSKAEPSYLRSNFVSGIKSLPVSLL